MKFNDANAIKLQSKNNKVKVKKSKLKNFEIT